MDREDSSLSLVASGFDPEPLLAHIAREPVLWTENTWRQDEAGGQQDTEAIMLRWACANSFESVRDSLSCITLPFLAHLTEAHPLLETALSLIEAGEIGRIFIVKLKPGGRVYPHSDVGLYADHFERFHLCLKAEPEFEYHVQHPTGPIESCNMKPGELWWFNHKRVHWAYNGGTEDRITIIIDCVAPHFKRKRDVLAVGVGYQKPESPNA